MKLNDIEKGTLLAFAGQNMNIMDAARKLYVHRNTVIYRLEQIRKKTGLNPRCFYDLIQLVELVNTHTPDAGA